MRRVAFLFLLCIIALPGYASAAPQQKYVVFFQEWSAKLDKAALAVIGHASAFAKAHPMDTVHVNAFADPTGSRAANNLLTELRAQVVMDKLQADSVAAASIVGRGNGSVQFALNSVESRRVEISIGGD